VLADEQVQVLALLVGELEENPLALGLLEPLAVALEELVRAALAADADEQRGAPRIGITIGSSPLSTARISAAMRSRMRSTAVAECSSAAPAGNASGAASLRLFKPRARAPVAR
jgi:hypothetical protein